MKLLLVTSFYPPYHVGGACTHVYYLAQELAKAGHEVHVLYSIDSYYLKRSSKPDPSKYPNHQNITLHAITTPLGKVTPLISYITGLIPFSKKIKQVFDQDFDVIHYHNISLFGPRVFSYGNAKKIYTVHDHWLVCPLNDNVSDGKMCSKPHTPQRNTIELITNKRPPQLWRWTDLLKTSLEHIDLIISPSEYLKQYYEKQGITKKILVLPNFVPEPPPLSHLTRKKDYFIYMGMLEEIKGIPLLLDTFKELPHQKLLIAGTGSLQKQVVEASDKCENIAYLGFVNGSKKYEYLAGAKALILPSLCPENCPNVILEAMSVGTISIGTNRGGIPGLIKNTSSDLIIPQYSKDTIKKTIRSFDEKNHISERVKKIFAEKYTARAFVEQYMDIISAR